MCEFSPIITESHSQPFGYSPLIHMVEGQLDETVLVDATTD
jgi:hypothetical protein